LLHSRLQQFTVGRTSAAAKNEGDVPFSLLLFSLFLFNFNLNYIPIMSNTSKEIIT